jgi:hypothetical protein
MRIHHRGASEGLQHAPSTASADRLPSGGSGDQPGASAPNDAVQLSYLSGVLNSLHAATKNDAAKTDCVARLVRQNKYQVDAIALSRKLIGASLQ